MKKFIISFLLISFLLIIIVFALFIVDWHFPKISSRHREPNKYELLYEHIAVDYGRPEFCERISPLAYWAAPLAGPGSTVGLERSNCFKKVALNQNNPQYCDKVKPISTWFLNGSRENPDTCRTRLKNMYGSHDFGVVVPSSYARELLQEMGFNYKADPDYQKTASIPETNPYYSLTVGINTNEEFALGEYWHKIENEDTINFIQRARKLPVMINN